MTIPAISIVKSDGEQTAIWRISLGDALLGSRSGAWVYPNDDSNIPAVIAGTYVLDNVDATTRELHNQLQGHVEACQIAFDEYGGAKKTLTFPSWPTVSSSSYTNPAASDLVNETLAAANRLGSTLEGCRAFADERDRLVKIAGERDTILARAESDPELTERRRATLAEKREAVKAFADALAAEELTLPFES